LKERIKCFVYVLINSVVAGQGRSFIFLTKI